MQELAKFQIHTRSSSRAARGSDLKLKNEGSVSVYVVS